MVSIWKTILDRLERIEKRLAEESKPSETPKIAVTIPKEEKAPQPVPPKLIAPENREVVVTAEREAREIIISAKDEAFKIKREAEDEARRARQEALSIEQRLIQKEETVDRKISAMEDRERTIVQKNNDAEKRLGDLEKARQELLAKLEKAAQLTRDEAKNLILKAVEDKLKEDIAKRIREAESEVKRESDQKAKEILVEAMRHAATDYVPEYTVSVIKLPDDEFKGRIIGKEGRNVRAFEMASGVDVDLDEEGVIRLSSFDPVRREVARVALEKLIKDGRIQPVRIEEVVDQSRKEIEKIMFAEGEKLCHSVGVYNLPIDKVALLGRFKYRYSYGQNMIAHTLEETKIGIALARELGADVNIVRLGCLLHDIGKVITEKDGSHVQLGVDLLKKNGMPQAVIDCVAAHHEDIPFPSIEATIVYIADAISGSREWKRCLLFRREGSFV